MTTTAARALPLWLAARKQLYATKLHVALCAGACTLFWSSVVGLRVAVHQLVVVALVIAAVYQLNRLSDIDEDARNCPEQLAHALANSGRIMGLAISCAVTAGAIALLFDGWRVLPLGAVAILLAILYSGGVGAVRLFPKAKRLPWLKNALPAACWTAAAVIYPALAGRQWDTGVAFAAALMFCGCFTVEVLWDVRDVAGDRLAGVRTLPGELGVAVTRKVLVSMLATLLLVLLGLSLREPGVFILAAVPVSVLLLFTWQLPNPEHREAFDDLVSTLTVCLAASWVGLQLTGIA